MKLKFLFLVFIAAFLSSKCFPQYRVNKDRYDLDNYTYQPGDPYSPAGAAVASLFIPGLGQMVSGEGGRGLGFLIGAASCLVVSSVIAFPLIDTGERDPDFFSKQRAGSTIMLAGLAGTAGIWVWSISDASRVAKVNNLILREQRRKMGSIAVRPLIINITSPDSRVTSPGLAICINF